jgi:hypothetical protein
MTRKPLPFLIGAAMLMIATPALPQGGRVLQKTNMRTFTSFLSCLQVDGSFVPLLTPTTINCPGSSTCTLHIEVSANFSSLDVGAGADLRVEVDNVAALPGVGAIRVATNNGTAPTGSESRTFQFIKTDVQPGSRTVEWLARVSSGTASFCNGTQKINIYIP